jgi:hypothetical protein
MLTRFIEMEDIYPEKFTVRNLLDRLIQQLTRQVVVYSPMGH